jgi:hypothetical protein
MVWERTRVRKVSVLFGLPFIEQGTRRRALGGLSRCCPPRYYVPGRRRSAPGGAIAINTGNRPI